MELSPSGFLRNQRCQTQQLQPDGATTADTGNNNLLDTVTTFLHFQQNNESHGLKHCGRSRTEWSLQDPTSVLILGKTTHHAFIPTGSYGIHSKAVTGSIRKEWPCGKEKKSEPVSPTTTKQIQNTNTCTNLVNHTFTTAWQAIHCLN